MYNHDDCLAAIRGDRLPPNIAEQPYYMRLCVIRGIRYHHGFATDLRNTPDHPELTRALNARAIMSNEIPDVAEPEHFPYCIWYPDVASEGTYRALAKRYPQMRYQVGRACAVAGYVDLYRELHLLPDISIAEEARDCGHQELFDLIISHPMRWRVMDDYTRSVSLETPLLSVYGLNGDTAVRSTLELKRKIEEPNIAWEEDGDNIHPRDFCEAAPQYFNIT